MSCMKSGEDIHLERTTDCQPGQDHSVRHINHSLATRYFSVLYFRSKRVDRGLFFALEEYLVAVDLTSHVGIIPTWLASYLLV